MVYYTMSAAADIAAEKAVSPEVITSQTTALRSFLSRSFTRVDVAPVPDSEVTARGGAGGDAAAPADATSVCYRISVTPNSDDAPLDTDSDYGAHLRDQLAYAEQNVPDVSDSQVLVNDPDPAHLSNRTLVFYVLCIL